MKYTKTFDQCLLEAKKELNKRYITKNVAMLALQKWNDSKVK